jgi:hypothetical protein
MYMHTQGYSVRENEVVGGGVTGQGDETGSDVWAARTQRSTLLTQRFNKPQYDQGRA